MHTNTDFLDSSEILTEQDYSDLRDIQDIKKQVLSYIDMSILVNYISKLIDDSPFLSFKNERSKKYIDKRRPIFYIKVDKEKTLASKVYNDRNVKFNSQDDEVKFFFNVVYMEVISNVTSYITASLKQNPDLENYIAEKDIFKDIKKENRKTIADQTAVLSTMFGVRFSQDDSTVITLEMLL